MDYVDVLTPVMQSIGTSIAAPATSGKHSFDSVNKPVSGFLCVVLEFARMTDMLSGPSLVTKRCHVDMTVPRHAKRSAGTQLISDMLKKSTPEEEQRKQKIAAEKEAEELAEMLKSQAKRETHNLLEREQRKREKAAERQCRKCAKDKEKKDTAEIAKAIMVSAAQSSFSWSSLTDHHLGAGQYAEAKEQQLGSGRSSHGQAFLSKTSSWQRTAAVQSSALQLQTR
jgi:hypothetical protein